MADTKPNPTPPPAAPLRTDGPTLAEFVQSGYKAEDYPPKGYAINSLPPEVPNGAPPPPDAASPQPAAQTLEERVTELEAVVHQLASSVSGPHWGPGGWLERVGARIKAATAKKAPAEKTP